MESLRDYEFDALYNYAAAPVKVSRNEEVRTINGVKYIKVDTYNNGKLYKTHYECNLNRESTEQEILAWIEKVFFDKFELLGNSEKFGYGHPSSGF